jgi:hypothetical protein
MKLLVIASASVSLTAIAAAAVDTEALPDGKDGFEIGFFVNEPQKQQFGQLRATKTLCLLRTVLFGKLLRTSILV